MGKNNGGRAIFHCRSASHDPTLRGRSMQTLRWSDVATSAARGPSTRAGIDPASPAVVGARETGASCSEQEN